MNLSRRNNTLLTVFFRLRKKQCRQAHNIGRKMKYLCVLCETFAFFAVKFLPQGSQRKRKERKNN